jgi:hypothetical protein
VTFISALIAATFISALIAATFISALVAATFISALVAATFISAAFVSAHFFFMGVVTRLVLSRSHEIHRPVAGVVFAAMTRPVSRVPRWHVQIEWTALIVVRLPGNNHRLRINKRRRRRIANLYFTIDARGDFAADSNTDGGSSRMGRHTAEQE